MEHVAPSNQRQQRACHEENHTLAPDVQLIRRKRPRPFEINRETLSTREYSEKTPRLMMLPRLAELLAAQKQRDEGVATDALLDVLSRVASDSHESQIQPTQDEELELEDKTPWPLAKQYFDIFVTPTTELQIPVYDLGVDSRGVPLHPEFIYSQPVSCMYFLKCARLLGKGSFGFPRKKRAAIETILTPTSASGGKKAAVKGGKKESSKDFEWRKMSFVTGLPKKQPIVRYITATCYSRATDVAAKKKVFRMHAVMLADDAGTGENGKYVLVHIRAGGSKRVGFRASVADAEVQAAPSSPGAHGTVSAKQNADLLCMRRPVSPTSVTVSSRAVNSCDEERWTPTILNTEFSSSQGESSDHMTVALTGSPTGAAVTRPLLFTTTKDLNVDSARLALRNMILKSCTSPDEMSKYVMGLQEELAALQSQNQ